MTLLSTELRLKISMIRYPSYYIYGKIVEIPQRIVASDSIYIILNKCIDVLRGHFRRSHTAAVFCIMTVMRSIVAFMAQCNSVIQIVDQIGGVSSIHNVVRFFFYL